MQIMKNSNNPTIEDTKKLKQKISVLQQEHRQLKTFLNITQIISSELDLTILLQKIAKQVQDLLNADRCTLFLHDDK